MDVILSVSAWYNFLLSRLLFDAVFVIVALLMIFAFFNRGEYKNTGMLRFILTAFVLTLFSRYIYYMRVETRINTRYLYPVAFYVIILCVPGFPVLVRLGNYLFDFIPGRKEKILPVLLLAAIGIACVGKALHSPQRKDYIHDIAKIILAAETAEKPLLISNADDAQRIAWHAKAELMPLTSVAAIGNPANLQNAVKILSSKKLRIFFLLQLKNEELEKTFSKDNVKFPKQLIFIREFKVKHEKFYSLYTVGTNSGSDRDV